MQDSIYHDFLIYQTSLVLFCYWFLVCLGWGCCCLFVCLFVFCFLLFFLFFVVGFLGGWLLVFGWVVFCWFFCLVFFGWGVGGGGNYLGVVEASVVPPST